MAPSTGGYDVLVLGAGPAGIAAAVHAAELGARVAVAERGRVGGMCVNTGCVPTRVLAKTARLMRDVRAAGAYGVAVDDPVLVWERTVARVRQVTEDVLASKRTAEALASAGVDLYLEGAARFVDPHRVTLAGSDRTLSAGAVIVCVGGRPGRLPVPGGTLAVTAEQVLDLERLPSTVAIVGSGHTGVQLATVFRAFGAEVALLEARPRILPGADAAVAACLSEAFEQQGILVQTGIGGVERIEPAPADGRRRLTYRLDGRAHVLDADTVVACVGWPAAAAELGLDAAGVVVADGRIPVDAYLQSNVAHIYVAGDANGGPMLAQAARFEAEVAATNAVRGPSRRVSHALLPWGGFTDPDIAGVGLTTAEARQREPDCRVASVPYRELERAVIDNRTTGFLTLVANRQRSLLLGAHAAGEGAVEVVQAVAAAMAAGADVATLASVEYAYPTYGAIIGEAAGRLLRAPP
ncbi:MAG TPA: NAD(P)/FAD-dependent oxidoreductase [Egibacteraceae bacterium]|nr:NAD(P)/FAD-dependent oxidoreductase [Egibacteraceae bacterium]